MGSVGASGAVAWRLGGSVRPEPPAETSHDQQRARRRPWQNGLDGEAPNSERPPGCTADCPEVVSRLRRFSSARSSEALW